MKEDLNEFLPYCSNLDDCEYNSLWECYEEESLFKRFKNYVTNQIKYLIWTISYENLSTIIIILIALMVNIIIR